MISFHPPDGELYSGTAADFMGRDFAIFRTLGHHHPIRTEQHDSRWLNGMHNVHVPSVMFVQPIKLHTRNSFLLETFMDHISLLFGAELCLKLVKLIKSDL